jgi:hypothetical protein
LRQSYFCSLSFPQCVAMEGVYVELPVCWAYCLKSELACGGAALANQACTKGVAVRVRKRASGRPTHADAAEAGP